MAFSQSPARAGRRPGNSPHPASSRRDAGCGCRGDKESGTRAKCLFTGKVEKHNDIGMPVVNSSPNLIPSAENANKVLCVNQKIFYLLWDVLEKRAVKYGNCDSKNCTPLNRTENTHDYWGASTFDFVDKEFKDTPFIVKTLNASRFK